MKRKILTVLMAMVFCLGFARISLACGGGNCVGTDIDAVISSVTHTNVGVSSNNTNNNSNTNTNRNTNMQGQNQGQQQGQQQGQSQSSSSNSQVVDSGNSLVYQEFNSPEMKRDHISTLPGTIGSFVGAPNADLGNWQPFVCQPLFSVFTKERLENASGAGSFGDRKGGFFHRLFSSPIKEVVYIPFDGTPDDKPVTILNWNPSLIHPGDKLAGEFECEGYYGWPRGASLANCVDRAKKRTNTDRAFAYYRIRRDPKNSGFSYSSSAAGSILGGSGLDSVAGAISLGGLIGTTKAYVDEAVDWYVMALNPGPITPPTGVEVCVQKPPQKTEKAPEKVEITVKVEPAPASSAPPAPPVIKVEKPAPVVAPKEPEKKCDAEKIQAKIKIEEEKFCPNLGLENLERHLRIADLDIELYVCTGDKSFLGENYIIEKNTKTYRGAIGHFQRAEKNFLSLKGKEKENAQAMMDKAYEKWSVCIRKLFGVNKQMEFAADHHELNEGVPTDFSVTQ